MKPTVLLLIYALSIFGCAGMVQWRYSAMPVQTADSDGQSGLPRIARADRQGAVPAKALQEYVRVHASRLRHSEMRRITGRVAQSGSGEVRPASGPLKTVGVHRLSAAKGRVAKSDARSFAVKGGMPGALQIPSAKSKAKAGQSDDLLVPIEKHKRSEPRRAARKKRVGSVDQEHLNLFVENRYPSANACGVCHPKHYKEWSVSQHAYA